MSLGLEAGGEGIIALHGRLYSGSLERYLRKNLLFEPHIAIGFFGLGPYDPLNPEPMEVVSQVL